MEFLFDIEKSIASATYLVRKNNGSYNVLFLVKALYQANRSSFVQYGRSITGDRFVAMKNGPNVSETYDLINGSKHAKPEHLKCWQQFIFREGKAVKTIAGSSPNMDCLSGREIKLLDDAYALISSVKGRLDEWSHSYFPEWEKPPFLVGSVTIEPEKILRIEKKTPDQIAEIEEHVASVNWLKSIAS